MAADKKSNPAQISQAVLDETNQSVKVTIVSGGGGGGGGGDVNLTDIKGVDVDVNTGNASAGTLRVVLADDQPTIPVDIQDTSIAVSLDATQDSVAVGLLQPDGTYAPALGTENGATAVGNAMKKFRDGFVTGSPNTAIWDQAWINQGSGTVSRGGDAAGSSYLKISMCPFVSGSEYELVSQTEFKLPNRFIAAISASQRIIGQELEVSLVGVDFAGTVVNGVPISDLAISGTVTIATNVATINFAASHGLKGGDRVLLKGNAEPRLNVGPVVVTVVTSTQITVPCTLANGSYTAGGFVEWADPVKRADNAVGILLENATATNASFVARRNGASFKTTVATIATTVATQANTSPYTDAFSAAAIQEITTNLQEAYLVSRTSDSIVAPSGTLKYTQGIPDEEISYKIRVRAKNLNNLTIPVAKITAIAKTGTTTATVTTDVAHNLTTSDYIQIYGVRDQTSFPNLTAQTVVASIISPTQFTVVIGTAVTATSAGGSVHKVQGSVLAPGVIAQVVQSISRTNNILTIIGNGTWAGLLPGETVSLYGCDATSMGLYDGTYKVLRLSTTTLELESVGANFTSINCGGSVIKRTDYRVHFLHELEYTRLVAELANQNGGIDLGRALPVTGAVTVSSGTVTTVTTVTTVSAVTLANLAFPGTIADVASAALTTTTTTATLTPTFGSAYQVNIPVTVVSGTTPTLDVGIEESDDAGTNWFRVYDFPRITATGMYRSPTMPLTGNRVRYVQTVGGASPSFTRAVNRLQSSASSPTLTRQIYDRAVVLTTLSSTTASLYVDGCSTSYLEINIGAVTTTAPALQLQGSNDGTNWISLGSPLTAVASSTVAVTVSNTLYKFVRAIVTTAGVGVTAGYVLVKGYQQ